MVHPRLSMRTLHPIASLNVQRSHSCRSDGFSRDNTIKNGEQTLSSCY